MNTQTLEYYLRKIFSGEADALYGPEKPVEAHERVLGVLQNNVAKAVYSVADHARRQSIPSLTAHVELLRAEEKSAGCVPVEKKREGWRNLHRTHMVHETLMDIFWEMVREEFPQGRDQRSQLDIKEGWQVTFSTKPPLLDEKDILKNPFVEE